MLEKFDKFIGGLKFAVIVLSVMTLILIGATIAESFLTGDFIQRAVYKSPLFIVLQFFLFVSIFMSMLLRLPPVKKLLGFYIIHIGLLTIFIGSILTYLNGIDGQITLHQNIPNGRIELPDDALYLLDQEDEQEKTIILPYSIFPTSIDFQWKSIKKLTFAPFAQKRFVWEETKTDVPFEISEYLITDGENTMPLQFSNNQKITTISSAQQILSFDIFYSAPISDQCLTKKAPSKLLIWNSQSGECFTPEEAKLPIKKSKMANRFVEYTLNDSTKLFFYPDFNSRPLTEELGLAPNSPFRIFDLSGSDFSRLIFLQKNILTYHTGKKWEEINLAKSKFSLIKLNPELEMPLELKFVSSSNSKLPKATLSFSAPFKDQESKRFIEITKIDGSTQIIGTQDETLQIDGTSIIASLGKHYLDLPFKIELEKFIMQKNPGTHTPASFESFIKLWDRNSQAPSSHHIFMNNPLKFDRYTFYQSSYIQTGPDSYSSVLSVNYDPGRFLKYFGSLLLVLGSALHYFLRRKNKGAQ